MIVVLEWDQGPENLSLEWLFNVGCQNLSPQENKTLKTMPTLSNSLTTLFSRLGIKKPVWQKLEVSILRLL
jgi:hypothetical protein